MNGSTAAADGPLNLEPVTGDDGLVVYVYDLPIIAWERRAWLCQLLADSREVTPTARYWRLCR